MARRHRQSRPRPGQLPARERRLEKKTYKKRRIVFGAGIVVLLLSAAAIVYATTRDSSSSNDRALARSTQLSKLRSAKLARQLALLQHEASTQQAEGETEADTGSVGPSAPASSAATSGSRSFARLQSTLPGQAGLALTAPGILPAPTVSGSVSGGSAWSTIKLALSLRTTLDAGGPNGLSSSQRSLISRALTASDNAAAMELWNGLVSHYGSATAAATATAEGLRRAGDSETRVSTVGRDGFSPYGQTEWSLSHQAQFMGALAGGCLADAVTTNYLLGEMGQVISDQRWGLGSAGVPANFKGGWGPGTSGGYLVRQTGVLQTSTGPMVLAIAALPSDGSLESGAQMLTTIAQWAARHLSPPPVGGC
jgi:hypothetical protein